MENAIPSAILTKGISQEGLTNLLNGIEYAVIDEGIDVIMEEADKVISVLREKKPGDQTEAWVKKFQDQIAVLKKISDENMDKIEMLFERIFKDWEEYQKTHIAVIDLEDGKDKKTDAKENAEGEKEIDGDTKNNNETKDLDEPKEIVEEKPDVEETEKEEVATEGEKDE